MSLPSHRLETDSDPVPRSSALLGMRSGDTGALWAIVAILFFAVAFGGGGSRFAMPNLVVQLAALAALSFHRRAFFEFWVDAPLMLRLVVAFSIILPLVYIIPLPNGVWTALPGRELVIQSFELVDEGGWASTSVDPIRTLLALTALIAPLALLAIGWRASLEQLILAGWVVVALALCNLAIGIPQVLTNSEVGVLYPQNPMPGVLFGTFANRNSTGLFLAAALALAALLPAPRRLGQSAMALRVMICALLLVAVVLTRSRTAIVLALIPIGLVLLRQLSVWLALRSAADGGAGKARIWAAIVPLVAIPVVLAGVLALAPGRVGDMVDRFDSQEDARAYIWDDATYAAGRYWPIGSGTGTFDEVFHVDESLENLTLKRPGRAHNDYIELAIEAGVPGIALAVAWLLMVFWLSWRARKAHDRWIAWSGAVGLLLIALQSITDYPLRNLSLLTFAAFALLLLLRFGQPPKAKQAQEGSS